MDVIPPSISNKTEVFEPNFVISSGTAIDALGGRCLASVLEPMMGLRQGAETEAREVVVEEEEPEEVVDATEGEGRVRALDGVDDLDDGEGDDDSVQLEGDDDARDERVL